MIVIYRVVVEDYEVGLIGGMALIDLPSRGPDYNGSKSGYFWYTEYGWRVRKVAKVIRRAQIKDGVRVRVKVARVPRSAIVWSDGYECVVKLS